jgi:hypothetical protein
MHRSTAAIEEVEHRASSGCTICWVSAIQQQTVSAEAEEQNEGSEAHLKTKRFGWIGGLGSTFTFIIEWLGE